MTPLDEIISEQDIGALLTRMQAILVYASEGGALGREHSVMYLNLRSRLLESKIGRLLPGFLYQCASINRFKEFISLYDPEVDLRVAFIDRMLGRCRAIEADGRTKPQC